MGLHSKIKRVCVTYNWEEMPYGELLNILKCKDKVKDALIEMGFRVTDISIEVDDFMNGRIREKILSQNSQLIFNLFEGFDGDSQKEAVFVEILEGMHIPFTGNASKTLSLCVNKDEVKKILTKEKMSTPKGIVVRSFDDFNFNHRLKFPLMVKPCFEDGSMGIDEASYILNKEILCEVLKIKLKKFPQGLIVEEFIGQKEYSVGLLGNNPYQVLGISVIDYRKYKKFLPFLTYNSKWEKRALEYKKIIPKTKLRLNKNLKEKLIENAFKVGRIFSCKGYFRVDFREDQRGIFIIDVNPNPDISEDAGFAKQAYSKGYRYKDLIYEIVSLAIKNYTYRKSFS